MVDVDGAQEYRKKKEIGKKPKKQIEMMQLNNKPRNDGINYQKKNNRKKILDNIRNILKKAANITNIWQSRRCKEKKIIRII